MAVPSSIIPGMTSGLFIPQQRSIGAIVAQVTISEQERDELVITEHPVEQGAPISDHAYKRPSEVTIRAGWAANKSGDLSARGNGVYGLLLSWQASLIPFNLYTGKRSYTNMLIQTLTVTTDEHSEYALMADIVCRQVIIVKTEIKQAAINQDTKNQADPVSNATEKDNGPKETKNVGTGKGDVSIGMPEIVGTDTPIGSNPYGDPEIGMMQPTAGNPAPITPTGTQVEATISKNVEAPAEKPAWET